MKYKPTNGLYRNLFRNFLDLIILKNLDENPMYGSEIDWRVSQMFDSNVSDDVIRRLKILKRQGMLELTKKHQNHPRERKQDSRTKTYTITEQGKDRLHEYEEDYRSFVNDMGMLLGHS